MYHDVGTTGVKTVEVVSMDHKSCIPPPVKTILKRGSQLLFVFHGAFIAGRKKLGCDSSNISAQFTSNHIQSSYISKSIVTTHHHHSQPAISIYHVHIQFPDHQLKIVSHAE